jgi:ABC-2 type transport system ATP-binding protein
MTPPVETRRLTKRYGTLTAVDALDLEVRAGEVYGFLGPNGAGKTTTLRMLLGLVRPTSGEVRLFGRLPGEPGHLRRVGALVEGPAFYPYLSGRDNLRVMARHAGVGGQRVAAVLEQVELTGRAGDRYATYSLGMKQRLGVAAALLKDPRLVVLDEPTNGLDPAGMADMRLLVRRLAEQGITVLLSSHLMGEVEELCDRVAIVRTGRVVYEGSLGELLASTAGRYSLRTTDDVRAAAVAAERPGVTDVRFADGGLTLSADAEAVTALSIALGEAGIGIAALVPRTATLEELFFRMTEGDASPPPVDHRQGALR